jgi:predicted HicB family RNase H-like nuclease
MPISEARARANNKYIKGKTDELKIRVPKGDKEAIQAHADACGESLNGFVTRAIKNTMEQDNAAERK